MATTNGKIRSIGLGRSTGKVIVRAWETRSVEVQGVEVPLGDIVGDHIIFGGEGFEPVDHAFFLYLEPDLDTVNPTEMMRRNWMIELLQRALSDDLPVAISHEDTSALINHVRIDVDE